MKILFSANNQFAQFSNGFYYSTPVLATCGIRPPDKAFENTSSRLSRLGDSPEEEYNRQYSPAHLHKGGTDTVHGINTFITRLTSMSFQSHHQRLVDWTKPSNTALIVGTLTDLPKSKSQLVAENALLRQQLIILRRHVKRPACTKTDRLLLVLLAWMVRTWKQAHITRSARDAPAVASSRI